MKKLIILSVLFVASSCSYMENMGEWADKTFPTQEDYKDSSYSKDAYPYNNKNRSEYEGKATSSAVYGNNK
ncbi:MAG: hypothetical protein COV36_04325 [Alphaproteobacteria bacterium CG11_big_fil_rev_8_21_14_0_20_44_7]|nr:MAG: hypothetical protein COV36_04325 [Alphaproteobacteria bacterium CG11_big_fil_rev_8_21_14_0_20_44_7]